MNTLSKEKVQAISQLYATSENFRKTVDTSILTEANLASNAAKILLAAVDPGAAEPVTIKAPGKKRGPKPGSKRKSKTADDGAKISKKAVKKVVNNSTQTVSGRVTHKDAILTVLASANGSGMTKKDIETKLADINGYTVPSSSTLLTTLHGMKSSGAILCSGERPNLHYNLSK